MIKTIESIFDLIKSPEKSKNIYSYPFIHLNPEEVPIENDQRTHSGPFKGALDYILPLGTKIISAQDGKIVDIVDGNTEYGNDPIYTKKLNYITIQHLNGEFSQYCHLQNISVQIGDIVEKGQPLAETGLNGFMDKPHLHFFVFKLVNTTAGFKGLAPQIIK